MAKNYVIAMKSDSNESLSLSTYLRNRSHSFTHAGVYDEYSFYTLELEDEEVTFITLKFLPDAVVESMNVSMNDIIIRIFNAGHQPGSSS